MNLVKATDALVRDVAALRFGKPVTHVYNPLVYARAAYRRYAERFGGATREVVMFGMNPGPWGMAQTGVPFGDVGMVRDWLGIGARVGKPEREHPKRPVMGFDCPRGEVSGARVWGWARDRFGSPDRFFARFFVANYCPLCFMESTGRNRTPDKLPAREKAPLFDACDRHMRRVVEHLHPRFVIGVGRFAEDRARAALVGLNVTIGRVLHPSPANPQANRDWPAAMTGQLRSLGIAIPDPQASMPLL